VRSNSRLSVVDRLPAILMSAVLLASARPSSAQAPTIEAGVELIKLAVAVTDNRNRFVAGLTKQDFVLTEDGTAQQLTSFTQTEAPVTLIFMVDSSVSMERKLPVIRAAAGRFVSRLGPQDRAKVIQFSDRIRVLQDFTGDHVALETALKNITPSGDTRLHNAVYTAIKDLGRLDTTRELRRRAIVLLSDGEDTASVLDEDQVLDAARKGEVNIYPISLAREIDPNDPLYTANEIDASMRGRELFNFLGMETGGKAYFPSLKQVDDVYDHISEELRKQYVLGYVSTNPRREGKWRRIEVSVPKSKNARARHRPGYYEKKTPTVSR
jgi:Ca-activated chloride channel homolog